MIENGTQVKFNYYQRSAFNSAAKNPNEFYVVKETDGSLSFYLGDEPLSRDSLYLKTEDLSGFIKESSWDSGTRTLIIEVL